MTSVRAGAAVAVTVAEAILEVTFLAPKCPWPTATLMKTPASTLNCVAVWEPVQVMLSPGARLAGVAGQVAGASGSETVNGLVSVTLPMLVRTKL